MHLALRTKSHIANISTTISGSTSSTPEWVTPSQSHLSCTSGKVSNPHLIVVIVKLIDRKYNMETLPHHKIKIAISKHSCTHPQNKIFFYKASLHAVVRRRGDVPKKLNNKPNSNLTMSLKLSKLQPLTRDTSCINKMT